MDAYFVRGDTVSVYDTEANTVTGERSLSGMWAGFAGPLDAAVDIGNFNLYVFSGAEYVRIPFATQAVDDGYPAPIGDGWPGVTFDAIDAAMNWGDGKLYLFRGSRYARYDIAADRQDPGYPKEIAGNWGGVDAGWVGSGIDAAVNPGGGRAYFFKGDTYLTIDWHSKSRVGGPASIAEWPGLTGPVDAAWTNAPGRPPEAPSPTATAFVAQYRGFAAQSEAETGVPWLVTLGQAALESGWGKHAPGNNFFGAKAKESDPEESRQLLATREVLDHPNGVFPEVISVTQRPDGKWEYRVRDWFRRYPTPAESFAHHGRFLRDNARYARAFEHAGDPYEFARQLAVAKYATDPDYADILTKTMRTIEASSG